MDQGASPSKVFGGAPKRGSGKVARDLHVPGQFQDLLQILLRVGRPQKGHAREGIQLLLEPEKFLYLRQVIEAVWGEINHLPLLGLVYVSNLRVDA